MKFLIWSATPNLLALMHYGVINTDSPRFTSNICKLFVWGPRTHIVQIVYTVFFFFFAIVINRFTLFFAKFTMKHPELEQNSYTSLGRCKKYQIYVTPLSTLARKIRGQKKIKDLDISMV